MCEKNIDLSKGVPRRYATKPSIISFYKSIVIILLTIQASSAINAEDSKLYFNELAIKYAGVCEVHYATTEDGYILKLFRIPGNQSRPVLLMHGLIASSDDFIIRGSDSYAATLSNAGYDVWFGNYRGNKHSRRHISLDPDKDPSFWKFGAHEHGYYDVAATIDYILKKTGEEKLSLIGHSQGTMSTYILGSSRPEYNDKIKVFIALAPVCHIHHVQAKIPKVINFGINLRNVLQTLRIEEIAGYDGVLGTTLQMLCSSTNMGRRFCRKMVFTLNGMDPDGLEMEFMPIAVRHYPSGTSRMNLEHILQIILSKRFANYDYGPVQNLEKYGTKKSPVYDLRKVTIDTYLITAKNDPLSLPEDTKLQAKELSNVKEYIVVEEEVFNHIDHIWSSKAREMVHPKVLKILEKYN